MEDIIHMIKTNIKANHIKIENLYKSIFTEINNISFNSTECHIEIKHNDDTNFDSACLEIKESNDNFIVSYWDGYSLAEIEEVHDLKKALKIFKRYAKKMSKNLKRCSEN